MKTYLEHIDWIKEKDKWAKEEWFNAIRTDNIKKAQEVFSSTGIDINIRDGNDFTALFYVCSYGHIDMLKFLLSKDNIDVNVIVGHTTPLMRSTIQVTDEKKEMTKLLLKHPYINVTLKSTYDNTFIDMINNRTFIVDYNLQKDILKNDRSDIILFFNKYDLVDKKIKKEYPHIFQGEKLGLL